MLLAAGRGALATGLDALAGRWTGTDGLVGPPQAPITGLTTVLRPDLDVSGLPSLDVASLLPGGLPDNAVVVRVAVSRVPTGPLADLPWTPAAGRLLDLTTPALAPASFSVSTPATGEWVVALAPRADTSLGVTDPTGVLGQAARLQQVLGQLAAAGPVVLVALGGAGHAARYAADAVPGVTTLVTLGVPWSAVAFDSARAGAPADAVRLLRALLPAADPLDPDDADLARGRALVGGFMAAARGGFTVADLEAPRPDLAVRAGLTAVAVFGVLGAPAVQRAITAVFASGLAGRARGRAAAAATAPTSLEIGVQLPFSLTAPPSGHGVTVVGSAMLGLASLSAGTDAHPTPIVAASPHLRLDLDIAHTDLWLVGGPGTTPVGGALPLELRRLHAQVEVGLHGGASSASLLIGEGSALGADWSALLVSPSSLVTGELETSPLLPEIQALIGALTTTLSAEVAASPGAFCCPCCDRPGCAVLTVLSSRTR